MPARCINRRIYARARASGLTQADAYLAAGGSANSRNMAQLGHRIEREPRVKAMIESIRNRMADDAGVVMDGAWAKYVHRLHSLPDDPKATNFDVLKGAEIVGRAKGAFSTTVNVQVTHVIPYRRLMDAGGAPRVVEGQARVAGALPEGAGDVVASEMLGAGEALGVERPEGEGPEGEGS